MDLSAHHSRIATQLRELELDRDNPPLFIEHACSPAELDELTAAVSEGLAAFDLDDEPFWRTRRLPLLVIATEVGYEFGADHHTYWPKLEERLGVSFQADWRCNALAALFPKAIRPPPTEWARHFKRIALPVTHAILPKWLHEPLLELLLACPVRVEAGGAYFAWIEAAAARYPNLRTLLHPTREALAREVIEGILEVSEPRMIGQEASARFRRDIWATPSTRAKLREARARRPTLLPLPPTPVGGRTSSTQLQPINVPLSLLFEPLGIAIAPITLAPPLPPNPDGIRLFPLGERRPTSLSNLLRDGIPIARPLPQADQPVPLFDEQLPAELSKQLRLVLLSLRAHVTPPLLFTDRRGPAGVAIQILNKTFSATGGWFALVSDAPPPTLGLSTIGRVGGHFCVQADASLEAASAWLESLGFIGKHTPSLRLVGAAALEGPAGRLFAPQDLVVLEVDRGPVLLGDAPLHDGLYVLPGAGERSFTNPAGAGAVELRVTRASLPQRAPDVQIDLLGEAPTANALREGRLGLRIRGRAALAGLRARIAVEVDGLEVATVTTPVLPSLPCAVGAADPAWRPLVRALPGGCPITLRVEVGGLGRSRWWLEPEVAEVSWRGEEARGEREIVGYRLYDAHSPLIETDSPSAIHLKVPKYKDGDAGPGAGLCVAPRTLSLDAPPVPQPPARIQRDWNSIGPLLLAFQTWSTARTDHLFAEVGRKRAVQRIGEWVERALCGDVWQSARSVQPDRRGFGVIVAESLRRRTIAFDELAEEGWSTERGDAFVRAVGRALNGCEDWLREIVEEQADTDALVPVLEGAYRAVGISGEPDLACEPSATRAALQEAFESWEAQNEDRALLSRILPQSKRAGLSSLPFAEAGDEQLVDLVHAWLKDASLVSPWPREQVRALLGIWLWPARVSIDEAGFERALADQQGARAVRYAALRRLGALA